MMYNEKLVAVVKANGRILRETNGTVYIPFNTEYSIQIKNLHNTKAVVSIDIDGDDVCDDSQYVIHPNQTVEIEGFLRGNKITRKFKFIEKTQAISDFRGDDIEDGLIKLSYQFEFDWNRYSLNYWETNNNERGITSKGSGGFDGGNVMYGSSVNYCNTNIGATCDVNQTTLISTSNQPVASAAVPNDSGITGKGSKSNQTFNTASVGFLDPKVHTMVIQLKGGVQKPIFVRTKLQCNLCGRKWPSKQEFCGSCGNALRD